jgi:hypothetical protein
LNSSPPGPLSTYGEGERLGDFVEDFFDNRMACRKCFILRILKILTILILTGLSVICLNLDAPDGRMHRMVSMFYPAYPGNPDYSDSDEIERYLSESGCPGWKDAQDGINVLSCVS